MTRLRFDPWTPDFQGAYQADPAALDQLPVDVDIERPAADWEPLSATRQVEFPELVFIDGSRRMDARIQVEEDGGTFQAHGGLGTTAVGAVAVLRGHRARFLDDLRAARWCFTGAGSDFEGIVLEAAGSHVGRLHYRHVKVAETDPEGILQALQNRMRQEETMLALALSRQLEEALFVLDGPLPREMVSDRTIGYIKTTSIQRLQKAQLDVASRLRAGERTPIYLVGDGERRNYEWLLRLRDPAPWYYSLAGTVRIQVAAQASETGLSEFVKSVADWSCSQLPAFSSLAHQDPRAPQQLLPVRALEAELKRYMGNPLLLRRRIVRDYFAAED